MRRVALLKAAWITFSSPRNLFACRTCYKNVPATKTFELVLPPKLLVFQLKRFCADGIGRIDAPITFPLDLLDLTTRFAGSSGSSDTAIHLIAAPMPVIYQCFAVSNHIGAQSGSGHYTAHGRRGANWYLFDEAIIISGPQYKFNSASKEAYLLFYVLV